MINLKPYISLTTMMVLATIDDLGSPYVSDMYFRTDDDYNFYFKSKSFREHSKHIEEINHVAWSVVNTEKYEESEKNKKGLQFQWVAQMLTGEEAEKIMEDIYGEEMTFDEILQSGHMIYRCAPDSVKVYDETLYGGDGKIINFR